MFLNLQPHEGSVSFRSGKGKIKGIGKKGKSYIPIVNNILYVEGLNYNLLNISQFCNCGYTIVFDKDACIVKQDDGSILFIAQRKNNLCHIYFHPFGCECNILNTKDQLGKFDSKVDKGIFLGYSNTLMTYRVYNSRTSMVEKSIHVRFNDTLMTDMKLLDLEEDFVD
uniref:Retroviral polymerase SH3-like domain-containing protein n=1 Tax=Cajanus cajan TaxID=3821 RepID=A0A151T0I6_CAJCA|nr:hypothetical protein KK1_022981 [Cajanus cajan]